MEGVTIYVSAIDVCSVIGYVCRDFKTIWKSFTLENFKHIIFSAYFYSVIEINLIMHFDILYYLMAYYSMEHYSFRC